ncbi:MAG: T9SS type A sorting domain-containing protein, partial [candidate division KSB1 bacterium]|nr:T9SS type A sorting domain-containing protein [candidate division KSB1 bacterium]
SYNGKNEITWAALGTNGIIAQASCWFNTNGIILESDIVFNSSCPWGIGTGNYYDIETIALHEFGHWLHLRDIYGDLGDSVNDRAKVMYGFGFVNSTKRSLHPDDRDGIQYIYQQAPVFDDSWDTHELDISAVQAQIKAAQGYTQGTAAVYNEVSPLVTNQRSLRRWWAMHALDHAMIRLYFTASMLVEANFSGNPTIYHYNGQAWVPIATSPAQVEGNLLYVESLEPVTSWSPFALFDTGPIAVNLTSFIAQETAQGVELVWEAAQEINSAGYEIQRRAEGEAEWRTIASWTTHEELRALGGLESRLYRWVDTDAPLDGRILYRIRTVCLNGQSETWCETSIQRLSSSVSQRKSVPTTFAFHPAYPNPFNPVTNFTFDLPQESMTTITVLDISGRVKDKVYQGHLPAGRHHFSWRADNFASGIYLLCIESGSYSAVQRVVLVK